MPRSKSESRLISPGLAAPSHWQASPLNFCPCTKHKSLLCTYTVHKCLLCTYRGMQTVRHTRHRQNLHLNHAEPSTGPKNTTCPACRRAGPNVTDSKSVLLAKKQASVSIRLPSSRHSRYLQFQIVPQPVRIHFAHSGDRGRNKFYIKSTLMLQSLRKTEIQRIPRC